MSDYRKAGEVAAEAAKLVSGDRNNTHGDKVLNHLIIAALWNGYLQGRALTGDTRIGPEDVANMMECLKVARRLHGSYNPDDYVDGAGYAAVAGEIRDRMEKKDDSWVKE